VGRVIEEIAVFNRINALQLTPIVVNDCSTDNTLVVLKQLNCIFLDLPVNLGIGGAVQSGYKYAWNNHFDIAIQLDGDGQHPVEEIGALIQPIENNEADVVIGSRFITKKGFQSSSLRRTGIRYFRYLNRLLLGINITDSTSGFRAMNRKGLELVCDYYPDTYPEPEAIVLYSLNGLRITEIPAHMRERQAGTSSISNLSGVYYMVKVTLGILFIYFRIKSHGKRHSV
jgi:glycosyltransferase involved in cell wall biosynthesis